MHLLIRRGGMATQPTLITKQYIEFYFKLPANLLTMLSHVPPDAGPNAANWAEIFELKRDFNTSGLVIIIIMELGTIDLNLM